MRMGCAYLESSCALICVVSDGAGSALRSGDGSRIACEAVIREASRVNAEEVSTRSFALDTLEVIREEFRTASEEAGAQFKDFACTLLVAIVKCDSAVWQIGDGAICFRLAGEERDAVLIV